MSTDFDKFAILDSFLDEVASYVPEIEANLDRLQQNPRDSIAIEETYRRAHTIGGSAAMMDFAGLSHVALGMEEILGDALDDTAPLDAPTIALLRRSTGRLQRLLERARTDGEGAQIVAEDDTDRSGWRGRSNPGAVPAVNLGGAIAAQGGNGSNGTPPDAAHAAPAVSAGPKTGPHLPGWLAAFGGPKAGTRGAASSEPPYGVSQPSAPSSTSRSQAAGGPAANGWQASNPGWTGAPSAPGAPVPSVEDMIQAFRSDPSEATGPMGAMPAAPAATSPTAWQRRDAGRGDPTIERTAPIPSIGSTSAPGGVQGSGPSGFGAPAADVSEPSGAGALVAISPAWEELHVTEGAVRRQVGALRDVVATLREAAQAMEDERTELRTFLDGSKDALDRLEEWAGHAMGLNLRQSPEHVRRYLPLSVIWVTATRLKKLVALLNNTGRRVTASQEDINEALGEMHAALDNVGRLFSSVAAVASAAGGTAPDGSFRATLTQVTQVAFAPPERPAVDTIPTAGPVVERAATPADLPPGARAELERSVRDELRRELEDDVRAEVAAEMRREEESRLRHELEIQVRRQVLAELTPGLGAAAVAAGARGDGPIIPPLTSAANRAPKPVRVTDQSPEALDVFREEAEEHLQQITQGIRQLETTPGDARALQSVRRATHTLKGAAGMMGFEAIQQLAHASEDLLDRLVDGALSLSPDAQGLLLDTSEALERLVSGAAGSDDEQARMLIGLQHRYDTILGRPVGAPSDPAVAAAERRPSVPQLGAAPTPDDADASPDADLSVRLRLKKLDELINLFGDLLQNRSILEERFTRLGRMIADTSMVSQRLREVGTQLETRFEAAALPSGRRGEVGSGGGGNRPALGGVQSTTGTDWGRTQGNGVPGGMQRAPSSSAHLGEFDELELDRYTEFHRLSRGLSESVADMATLSSEMESVIREVESIFQRETRASSIFQDRLMKARLVPLQSLVSRLYRAARATALRQSKEVEFFVEGGDTELDRTVYEEVAGPLLHLVRNAVAHGIERPTDRQRAGKPRTGHVYLSAAEEGNQVVIVVRDDGAGVDPEKVRSVALARGLIDSYVRLTPSEALDLLFQPGFSTADTIDEESGRGVGLDVVKDAVTRLRGTVEVESTAGQGTTFTLRIPVSLQITRAVLARVGPQIFAIPMSVVEQIGRLDYYERARGGGAPAVEVRGHVYPLVHLASYLGLPPGPVDDKSPVLLFGAGRQRMALLLDAIPGRQEVVVKNLGPHLRDVRGVTGATVLGDGRVVLILNLPELVSVPLRAGAIMPAIPAPSGTSPRMPAAPAPTTAGPVLDAAAIARLTTGELDSALARPRSPSIPMSRPEARVTAPQPEIHPSGATTFTGRPTAGPTRRSGFILVVDDSPSVRRVVGNMLKANGWEVQTARDGIEALEAVGRQLPAAVLLDIEMPRMDGYELLATLRSQSQYRHLPLVVLTSRAAAKHQQRAVQLGADAYVVKPYQDEELLRTLDTLVAARQQP